MHPFNPSLSFVTASYSLCTPHSTVSDPLLHTYMKVCTHAFDPSLSLVIVSYYTTYNVCVYSDTYVCSGDASDKLAFVRIYVCSSYNSSLAGTDCGGSFNGRSFWVMTREAIEMNSRCVHCQSRGLGHTSMALSLSQTEHSTCSKPVLVTHVLWASLLRVTLCVCNTPVYSASCKIPC